MAVADVRANDIVNGLAAVSGNSSLSLVSSSAGITLNTSTGSVSVAQGTTPGSYTLVYQLCTTQGSPTTCTTSFATITVSPPLRPPPTRGQPVPVRAGWPWRMYGLTTSSMG